MELHSFSCYCPRPLPSLCAHHSYPLVHVLTRGPSGVVPYPWAEARTLIFVILNCVVAPFRVRAYNCDTLI